MMNCFQTSLSNLKLRPTTAAEVEKDLPPKKEMILKVGCCQCQLESVLKASGCGCGA